jgi:phage baseplate assembly protein W
MPIINSTKRTSPLDLNKNVTIGMAFPLDETNMFQGTESVKDQIKANLLNVLLTYPGERVNMPTFGVGLKQLIFEQKIDLESLKRNIQNQIDRYVPNVSLQSIRSSKSSDEHIISIFLSYVYLLDNTSDTIQLNFNN